MPRFSFVALFLCAGLAIAEGSEFTPLQSLGPGVTRVNALSFDGSVAVGESAGSPFRWTAGAGISALSRFTGAATDVSRGGEVVVGREAPPGLPGRGFRWIEDEEFQILPSTSVGGESLALSVSSDGFVTVGESHGAAYWVLDGPAMSIVGNVGLPSWAIAASTDGSVIVGLDGEIGETFRWENGRVSFLEIPGDATDMTPDAKWIIGGGSLGGFLWNAETGATPIGISPTGISDDGKQVVGSFGGGRPALWTAETGAVDLQPVLENLGLDLAGWTLTEVTAISGDGMTLTGRGIPPDPAMSGAWIATIPEPASLAVGASALVTAIFICFVQRVPTRVRAQAE